MKKYKNITIKVKEEFFDLVYGVLFEYPQVGIEEKFDELIVTFKSDDLTDIIEKNLLNDIKKYDSNAEFTDITEIEDMDWFHEFAKQVPITKINDKIGIAPEWKKDELTSPIKVIINPKMAFGTGEHATTKLMCLTLDKYVKSNSQWIDAGCGTGILSILISKLGAQEVVAFDNDEWSVNNSLENLELNQIDNVKVSQELIENFNFKDVDGIAANIFANLLMSSMKDFRKSLEKKSGTLILSGILKYDKDDVYKSAINNGFELIEENQEDEWVVLVFRVKK